MSFSCIGISDTWLHEHNQDLYNINGYSFISNVRQHKLGGGVVNRIYHGFENNEYTVGIFINLRKRLTQ